MRAFWFFATLAFLGCGDECDAQNLLFSDNFNSGSATGWTEASFAAGNYTPNTAATNYVSSPAQGAYAVHYYALTGTNEVNAAKLTYEFVSLEDEVFLVWYDYFSTDFPFASTSQKMARLYYYNESFPASRKEITVVSSQENLYVDYSFACGLWGDSSLCNVDFANASGATPHPLDQWVKWSLHVKLNTPGFSDGFIRLYRNDSLYLSNTNVDLRGTDTRGFNAFWVGGNYSMAGGDGDLTSSGSRYIDSIEVYDGQPSATETAGKCSSARVNQIRRGGGGR